MGKVIKWKKILSYDRDFPKLEPIQCLVGITKNKKKKRKKRKKDMEIKVEQPNFWGLRDVTAPSKYLSKNVRCHCIENWY